MTFLQGPKALEQSREACLFQHSVKAAPYAMLIVDGEKKIGLPINGQRLFSGTVPRNLPARTSKR